MSRYYDDNVFHSGIDQDEILHYGILGMKWGIRRYQPYSYTGGSGKEAGEAKKLAKLSNKSEKLQKKIDKLEKKRTNRFAIATNARYRGQMGDKQQKLIKKKAKIDRKIEEYPDKYNRSSAKENLISARRNLNSALNKAEKVLTGAKTRKKAVIKENRKIRDEALKEINKARKILGEDEFNTILKKERFRADLIEALKTGAVTATVTGPYAAPELIRRSVSKQDRVDELAKKKRK